MQNGYEEISMENDQINTTGILSILFAIPVIGLIVAYFISQSYVVNEIGYLVLGCLIALYNVLKKLDR